MKAPTTDQIRDQIDRGLTGEKVAASDPAAAPLGTDAEAGGAPPTATERKMEAAARPKLRGGHTDTTIGPWLYLGELAAVGIILVSIVLLAQPA